MTVLIFYHSYTLQSRQYFKQRILINWAHKIQCNHNFYTQTLTIEVEEGNHENYDSGDGKEREDMFKRHNFKTIRCNPNGSGFDINKFLGKINSYVAKLRKKKQKMRWSIKLLKTLKK